MKIHCYCSVDGHISNVVVNNSIGPLHNTQSATAARHAPPSRNSEISNDTKHDSDMKLEKYRPRLPYLKRRFILVID